MSKREPILCVSCRQMRKFCRAHGDRCWCQPCTIKLFSHITCSQCSKLYRRAPSDASTLCPTCTRQSAWKNQPCVRCKKAISSSGRVLKDGTLCCRSCYTHHLRPPSKCHYCDKLAISVCRDLPSGINEPACERCRYKLGRARSCAGCRRPRLIAGERDGKGYCAACLPTGHPPLVACTDCGKLKYHYGAGRCEDCAWLRIQARLLRSLSPQIPDYWARELYEGYYWAMHSHLGYGVVDGVLKRDLPFFIQLSNNFTNRTDMTGVLVARRLGHEVVRKHMRAMSYLSSAGVISTHDDPDYEMELHLGRVRTLFERSEPWIHHLADRFLRHLLRLRDRIPDLSVRHGVPTRPKSIEGAIRGALLFLEFARAEGAGAVNELTQDHLDQFIGRNQRMRFASARFVKYLNRNEPLFRKLRIHHRTVAPAIKGIIPEDKRQELIALLIGATEPTAMRWSLALLFTLVYAQPLPRVLRMQLAQIRYRRDDCYEAHFSKVWIPLDPGTSALLQRWLELSRREGSAFDRDGTNAYLFPGRRAGTHGSPLSAGEWVSRNTGVGVRSLLTTSIAHLAMSGASHRAIIDAFGVSAVTLNNYARALGTETSAKAALVYAWQGARGAP